MRAAWIAGCALCCTSTFAAGDFIPLQDLEKSLPLAAPGPGIPAPALKPVLGQGYDLFKNELRSDCVAGNGHDYVDGRKGVALLDAEFINTTSDMQAYDKASQQSASLSFVYKLFTAELGDEVHTEKSFNSVDQYARIYRRIVTQVETRNAGVWSSVIQPVVNEGLNKPAVMKSFMEQCGTHFVSAVYRGDIVDQTIHFKLKSESYKEADKKTFSAGLKGLFSVGYSDKQSEDNLKTVSDYTFSKGGDQGLIGKIAPDPNSPGGILTVAKYAHTTYADQVAEAEPSTSAIIGIEVRPYWRFNLPGREFFGRWQDDALDGLLAKQGPYSRLLSAMGDISFAMNLTDAQRTVFYDETSDTLKTKMMLAGNLKKTFLDTVDACYRATTRGNEGEAAKTCGLDLKSTLPTDQIAGTLPKTKN